MQISVASHFTPSPTHLSRDWHWNRQLSVMDEEVLELCSTIFQSYSGRSVLAAYSTNDSQHFFTVSQFFADSPDRWNATVQQSHMLHRLPFRLLRFFLLSMQRASRAVFSKVNFSLAVESLAEIVSKENRRRDERRKMKLTQLFVQFMIDLTPL